MRAKFQAIRTLVSDKNSTTSIRFSDSQEVVEPTVGVGELVELWDP